jgi:hypothetical protein
MFNAVLANVGDVATADLIGLVKAWALLDNRATTAVSNAGFNVMKAMVSVLIAGYMESKK